MDVNDIATILFHNYAFKDVSDWPEFIQFLALWEIINWLHLISS